jgi:hypothetical protein
MVGGGELKHATMAAAAAAGHARSSAAGARPRVAPPWPTSVLCTAAVRREAQQMLSQHFKKMLTKIVDKTNISEKYCNIF